MNTVTILLPYILTYNYLAILLITIVADLFLPIPSGAILMASAAFASQGYFSFFWVFFFGSLGNIIGDNLGYWLARKYGLRVLYNLGFRKRMESNNYKKLEIKIKQNSGFLIFITRFNVISSLFVNIIAGLSKISYKKFLFFDVAGETIQVLFYCTIGYIVGNNWQTINSFVDKVFLFIILLIISLILIFWKKIWGKIVK